MTRPYLIRWRFLAVIAVGMLAFTGVTARLVYLQSYSAQEIVSRAPKWRRTTVATEARRGNIYDSRGSLLAGTRVRAVIGLDLNLCPPLEDPNMRALASLLGMSTDVFKERLASQRSWVKLKDVNESLLEAIRALKIRGVTTDVAYARVYPGGDLAPHLLGFVNRDGDAISGVERTLNFYLEGQNGWKETERDGAKQELAAFREREVPPRDGLSVQLTIDSVVQDRVRAEIERLVAEYQPEGVSIIITEVGHNRLLALANYPTFDPAKVGATPTANLRNRAVTDRYEPGSTFKIVPVAGALEEHLVNPHTLVDCKEPVAEFRGRKVRLPNDDHPIGVVPVHEVVARSSNRGAARLGMLLGEDRLYSYCHRFGFGQTTGWPLGDEVAGTLHEVKDWDGLTISRLPAGYAVAVTPLQVHQAMSTIAHEGLRYPPRVLDGVLDTQGERLITFPYAEPEAVVSPETARGLAAMLQNVVGPDGTARRAALKGFAVAGKTGTSRKIIDGQYSNQHHIGSFSGFFPAQEPRFVITVVVDDAQIKGTAYGGVVAAPAFRNLAEWLVQYYQMQPEPALQPFVVHAGANR